LSTSGKNKELRRTSQYLIPVRKETLPEGKYDIYPSLIIGDNLIFAGYESLAERIKGHSLVMIDGCNGVFFSQFQFHLDMILKNQGFKLHWFKTDDFFKPEDQIRKMISPYVGGDDPLFGNKTSLDLEDFFIPGKLQKLHPGQGYDINIVIGPGASLVPWDGLLIYIDVPKNEIRFRSRAGSITNLGLKAPSGPKEMYKQFYFVDWVILSKHRQRIVSSVDICVDGQRQESPVWMESATLSQSLYSMSRNVFRARPWFEPGVWGGTWIRDNIPGLNKDVDNYAWSFELITPENGLLIESSSVLCEVSFDWLMFVQAEAVLGDCYSKYGTAFPIRFDFLDTFDGGNLSLQCHPRPSYIKEIFGEDFTQEEAYYILDTKDNAGVYLGFNDDIDPGNFRKDLEKSYKNGSSFEPENYIQWHKVNRHDLLLIPYGTIHGSGRNNLVLEISTTPYIFTFKMYDWLRPDLDGKPRPLNIERGMANLFFDRKGGYVKESLISKAVLIQQGPDWKLFNLPTHPTHSYGVQRYHFSSIIDIPTNNKCLVMNLTEGGTIETETGKGMKSKFRYAETFVVPAAAGHVRINNLSGVEAILVIAYIK
jgi:mannose-6-phosphate isomerase class I